jgi:hypothetical protein
MARPTPGERLVSAILGIIFGAVIGVIVGWLANVYSNGVLFSEIPLDMEHCVLVFAVVFGLVGLFAGSDVGSAAGGTLEFIYREERDDSIDLPNVPSWMVKLLVVIAVVVGVYLGLRKG